MNGCFTVQLTRICSLTTNHWICLRGVKTFDAPWGSSRGTWMIHFVLSVESRMKDVLRMTKHIFLSLHCFQHWRYASESGLSRCPETLSFPGDSVPEERVLRAHRRLQGLVIGMIGWGISHTWNVEPIHLLEAGESTETVGGVSAIRGTGGELDDARAWTTGVAAVPVNAGVPDVLRSLSSP